MHTAASQGMTQVRGGSPPTRSRSRIGRVRCSRQAQNLSPIRKARVTPRPAQRAAFKLSFGLASTAGRMSSPAASASCSVE